MIDRCSRCESLKQFTDTGNYYCGITCKKIEEISEKPEWCPHDRNCHEYCRYGKMCRYCKGENGMDPGECGLYYKLEDIEAEAREIQREQRRMKAEELGWIDESEVDDW